MFLTVCPHWVHIGTQYVHSESTVRPQWVYSGSTVGPQWVHSGSTVGLQWVYSGLWVHCVSTLCPHRHTVCTQRVHSVSTVAQVTVSNFSIVIKQCVTVKKDTLSIDSQVNTVRICRDVGDIYLEHHSLL